MGRYQEGLLGHFSGKVEPVIGSSCKPVEYMRGKGKFVRRRVIPKIAAELQLVPPERETQQSISKCGNGNEPLPKQGQINLPIPYEVYPPRNR